MAGEAWRFGFLVLISWLVSSRTQARLKLEQSSAKQQVEKVVGVGEVLVEEGNGRV